MTRLKAETAAAHAQTEAQVDVMRPDLSPDRYRSLLERFYGFFAAWEPAIDRALTGPWREFYQGRRKLPLLAGDLRRLGIDDANQARLAVCDSLPDLSSLPRVIGSMYVIEGSTLGGQIIAKHVNSVLQLDQSNGAGFFSGYGPDTMRNWREFGALAEQTLPPAAHDEAIRAAGETFECIGRWLRG